MIRNQYSIFGRLHVSVYCRFRHHFLSWKDPYNNDGLGSVISVAPRTDKLVLPDDLGPVKRICVFESLRPGKIQTSLRSYRR